MQDLAVIPLMVLVVLLSAGGTLVEATMAVGRTMLLASALVVGFILFSNWVVPRILELDKWSRNRELPILFAIVLALGSAYGAHAAGVSPAIGAFVAGVVLGGSPMATQIRADVSSLRTLLVTMFFSSIGLLGDPAWVVMHWHLVVGTVMLVVVGKVLIIWGVVRLLGHPHGIAVATGLCLGQVGEFSFVLAETAGEAGGENAATPLIGPDLFSLIVSATIVTLFLTPFMVALAPRTIDAVDTARRRLLRRPEPAAEPEEPETTENARDIVIIGFGPAGQSVASALFEHHKDRIVVIELNPRTASTAVQFDLPVHRGDAAHHEVLEHAGVPGARVIAITIPDAIAARSIIHLCRLIAPDADIIARSRYHVHRWELVLAGAAEVIDEEEQVGLRIAARVRRSLHGDEGEGGKEKTGV